jgi:5-oxoprolinase (ATP-hydrolysing) subunit A
MKIELNADLGEGFPNDEALIRLIDAANIACGFHAGNYQTMHQTVRLAKKQEVTIGAHVSYWDRENFGRKSMNLSENEIYDCCIFQMGALFAFCKIENTKLSHVKPHGALYNDAAKNKNIAQAIAQAVFDFDKNLILYGLSGSESISEAEKIGLRTASEVFADRTYQKDGSLTPRNLPNAMIHDSETALKQVMMIINEQQVTTLDKTQIDLKADTICVHGDELSALELAQKIRAQIK